MSEFNRRCMMATNAIHQHAVDISRYEEDYCYVQEQNAEGYVGAWVEGYGFVRVLFPFETTRELTPEEQEFVGRQRIVIV